MKDPVLWFISGTRITVALKFGAFTGSFCVFWLFIALLITSLTGGTFHPFPYPFDTSTFWLHELVPSYLVGQIIASLVVYMINPRKA